MGTYISRSFAIRLNHFFLGSNQGTKIINQLGKTIMNQIQTTTATNEVTVNLATGEAFISNRKLAKDLGVDESTTRRYFAALNVVITQGVTAENMLLCTQHFAQKGNSEAIALLVKISQAGAKAYLYHDAGLSIGVTQQRPLTQLEAYEELVRMEKTRLALLDTVGAQQKVMEEDAILTAKSQLYYPISQLKQWIPAVSGKLLSRMSEQLGYEVRTIYSHYDSQTPIQTYHKDVINTVYETEL